MYKLSNLKTLSIIICVTYFTNTNQETVWYMQYGMLYFVHCL